MSSMLCYGRDIFYRSWDSASLKKKNKKTKKQKKLKQKKQKTKNKTKLALHYSENGNSILGDQ